MKYFFQTMKEAIVKIGTNCVAEKLKTCNKPELTKISQQFAEFVRFFNQIRQVNVSYQNIEQI